ncbi:MAG: carboxypeptidase regulatory-like domain-containing protein, partial [Gemmatimonadaceae bacterium]
MPSTLFTWLAVSACLTTVAHTPQISAGARASIFSFSETATVPALIGSVRDSAGAPLSNVQVIISSLNRVATTSSSGSFAFRGLPAGHYHLDAILLGYARADAEVTLPGTGDDVCVDIVMRRTVLRLGGVVVSASPAGHDAMGITQSTIDLSGKELARSLGSSVAQTLSSEPGMAMRYGGPAATTPIIRGLSGERILVLQDGDRTGDLSAAS